MRFELFPIIDTMIDLYQKPRSMERFKEYISILEQEKKGDLAVPISGFNPMAKEHVIEKLQELKKLNAEKIIQDIASETNLLLKDENEKCEIKIVLNLADDLMGGWTNRFTTDYSSKFKLNALVNRNFCTPFFWTGENYTEQIIAERTKEYIYRTIYWLNHPKPQTLREHIDQEIFVAKNKKHFTLPSFVDSDFEKMDSFYNSHQSTEEYAIIFNFLYGEEAAKSLSFPTYNLSGKLNGFDYARILASRK